MTTTAEVDIDPDPFGIGIGIFAAMVSGASFLEARRQTRAVVDQQRAAFRAAWFEARRSLIFFQRWMDEFETYVLEDGYGGREFRVGSVRLVLTPRRAQEMKQLRGQTLITAQRLGDDLDDLSNFLGPDDQDTVTSIIGALDDLGRFPERYADLLVQGRAILALYTGLLDAVARRERFGDGPPVYAVRDA